ncbi:MAG: hypothetical protein EBZ48_14065, partial [Proteobacteria bacterium]|nr:hypothetical protein [Pseudomonadota bacterium]
MRLASLRIYKYLRALAIAGDARSCNILAMVRCLTAPVEATLGPVEPRGSDPEARFGQTLATEFIDQHGDQTRPSGL